MKNSICISFAAFAMLASSACAKTVTVNDEESYNQHVLQNSKCCVVKFAAEWCGVCKGVKDPFEQIADEDEFKDVEFIEVNIDQATDLTKKQGIVGVPTFIYVAQGATVDQEVGVQDVGAFKENMRNNIRKNFANKPSGEQVIVVQKESEPAQEITKVEESEAKPTGIIETIIDMIKRFIDMILGLIRYTVDAIKGLFGN